MGGDVGVVPDCQYVHKLKLVVSDAFYSSGEEISDRDWTIVRHDITGVILRRFLGGFVALEGPDSKCKLTAISIEQLYDGAQYGKSRFSASGIGADIDCANVK